MTTHLFTGVIHYKELAYRAEPYELDRLRDCFNTYMRDDPHVVASYGALEKWKFPHLHYLICFHESMTPSDLDWFLRTNLTTLKSGISYADRTIMLNFDTYTSRFRDYLTKQQGKEDKDYLQKSIQPIWSASRKEDADQWTEYHQRQIEKEDLHKDMKDKPWTFENIRTYKVDHLMRDLPTPLGEYPFIYSNNRDLRYNMWYEHDNSWFAISEQAWKAQGEAIQSIKLIGRYGIKPIKHLIIFKKR